MSAQLLASALDLSLLLRFGSKPRPKASSTARLLLVSYRPEKELNSRDLAHEMCPRVGFRLMHERGWQVVSAQAEV